MTCDGDTAAIIEIRADDLIIGSGLSSFCLSIDDPAAQAPGFARVYSFNDELSDLPQTLTVDPGNASTAVASTRGYLGGIEVARDRDSFSFDGVTDLSLSLARCPPGGSEPAVIGGRSDAPGNSLAVASFGNRGTIIVSVGANTAARFSTTDGLQALTGGVPPLGGAPPQSIVAFDADGDCDDDIVLGYPGQEAVLWRRQVDGRFVAVDGAFGALGDSRTEFLNIAVADVDGDADIDIVSANATTMTLWKNDGLGRFTASAGSLVTDATSDVSALVFANINSDAHPDLIIGRATPSPIRLLLGSSSGNLVQVTAAAPATPLTVADLAITDLDGDRVDDVVIATTAASVRVFAGRGDGRLEDRSFLYFPDGAPIAVNAVAAADWSGDCLADLFTSTSAGATHTLRGTETGFVDDSGALSMGQVQGFFDLDDDGDQDVLLIDREGMLTWLER